MNGVNGLKMMLENDCERPKVEAVSYERSLGVI